MWNTRQVVVVLHLTAGNFACKTEAGGLSRVKKFKVEGHWATCFDELGVRTCRTCTEQNYTSRMPNECREKSLEILLLLHTALTHPRMQSIPAATGAASSNLQSFPQEVGSDWGQITTHHRTDSRVILDRASSTSLNSLCVVVLVGSQVWLPFSHLPEQLQQRGKRTSFQLNQTKIADVKTIFAAPSLCWIDAWIGQYGRLEARLFLIIRVLHLQS